ncbi:MAG TPA: phosphopantetheine-binding protein, partial [Pyrinomonadaceae bacterium]|nr:phosphopantetheine-binding protein [Pyrinomonadaceae bacterium]
DGQVKVLGCRVESGEVEAAVRGLGGVRGAAVAAREGAGGQTRLVAFVVASTPGEDLSSLRSELRRRLTEQLPEYMVPSSFVFLDELPVLPSGKLDRNALREPEGVEADAAASYVAPRTPLEKRLAEMWAELLEVERVSVRDNFFELGGHSLLATELISRIREDLQVELPMKVLFRGAQTVEVLAAEIESYMIDYASDGDLAAALEEFDQLSEEEIKALLAIEESLELSLEED